MTRNDDSSPVRYVKTGCPLDCWDTCGIVAQIDGNTVTRLQGDKDHPITAGFLCSRGRRLRDRLYSQARIQTPLKRKGDSWQPVSWDQALDEIAYHVTSVLRSDGHHSILHAFDYGSGTILKNLNQRFFYQLGGCTETVGSLCWDAGITAARYDFGQAKSHHPEDLMNARTVVVWGRNVSVTNIHMIPFLRRAAEAGTEIVVVNPIANDFSDHAAEHIAPRPGTDGALALGVLRICRDNGWLNKRFVTEQSVGWDELSPLLDAFSLDFVTAETDVSEQQILNLARRYGTEGPVATLLGPGMQRYPGGGNAIRAIDALAAATGNVGVRGGGVQYAEREVADWIDQESIQGRKHADVREFTRGEQADQILAATPPIKMLFVTRTNPITQVPNSSRLREAYSRIPVKVGVDQFLTETAKMMDYVLPCTHVLEDEDFIFSTMWHPYITYICPAAAIQGDAKPEWWIFGQLANRLGFGDQMNQPIHAWMERALAPCEPYGVTLERLMREGTVRLPVPRIAWENGDFKTSSGRFEFASDTAEREGRSRTAIYIPPSNRGRIAGKAKPTEYPYALLTIHPRFSENSQHKDLPHIPNPPTAIVSTKIARDTGIKDGSYARLWNEQGSLVVRVQISDRGHPDTIVMESGWWHNGSNVNQLTPTRSADLGTQTAQYDCSCAIAPVSRFETVQATTANESQENL